MSTKEKLQRLDSLDTHRSEAVQLTEHQRVVEATKHLPAEGVLFIHDQKTYDAFRYGLSVQEAVRAALAGGRVHPDAEDYAIGRQNIEQGVNRGTVNETALDDQITMLQGVYGEELDVDAPIKPLEIIDKEEFAAVLAGLYSGGTVPTSKQRELLIADPRLEIDGFVGPKHVLALFANCKSLSDLSHAVLHIPDAGDMRKKLTDFLNFQLEINQSVPRLVEGMNVPKSAEYYDEIRAQKKSTLLQGAEASVNEAYEQGDATEDQKEPAAGGVLGAMQAERIIDEVESEYKSMDELLEDSSEFYDAAFDYPDEIKGKLIVLVSAWNRLEASKRVDAIWTDELVRRLQKFNTPELQEAQHKASKIFDAVRYEVERIRDPGEARVRVMGVLHDHKFEDYKNDVIEIINSLREMIAQDEQKEALGAVNRDRADGGFSSDPERRKLARLERKLGSTENLHAMLGYRKQGESYDEFLQRVTDEATNVGNIVKVSDAHTLFGQQHLELGVHETVAHVREILEDFERKISSIIGEAGAYDLTREQTGRIGDHLEAIHRVLFKNVDHIRKIAEDAAKRV